MSLSFKVYHSGPKAIFDVTSTIIYGEKDAFLVDAQFQKSKAQEVVREIKALGKELKVIFISHFDPDYYFGLSVIHDAFPNAEILSTAQTAWMISATMEPKLKVWKDALGDDKPDRFIVPKAVKELPLLENHEIKSSGMRTMRPTPSSTSPPPAPSWAVYPWPKAAIPGWRIQRA